MGLASVGSNTPTMEATATESVVIGEEEAMAITDDLVGFIRDAGLAVVVVVIERWGPRARRRRAVQPARTRLA